MSNIKKEQGVKVVAPASDKEREKVEKQHHAVIKEIEKKEKEKKKVEKKEKKEKEKQDKKEKRRSGSFSLGRKKAVVKVKKDGPASNGERKTEKDGDEGEKGLENSDLIKILERLKANDTTLVEIDNPSIVREIHVVGKDFIKIVSDCLVFNTHLLRLDLSGCEITVKQAELLGEALKVNSTLEYLNLSWNNLGDAGVAAIAPALGENEGLKKVDLRNNGLTPKAMHTLATALKGNVTLLHLKLSESAPIFVTGDDLIITENLDNSHIQRQETSDINELEKILLANREVAKCFTGDSVTAKLSDRGLAKIPPLLLVLPTLVHLDLSHNQLTFIPRAIKALTRLEHLNLSNNLLVGLPREFGALVALKHLDLSNNKLSQLPLTLVLLNNLEVINVRNNILTTIPTSFGTLPNLRELHVQGNQTLTSLPKQVLTNATLPLTHLKDQNKGSLYCYRVKLMCVGQANVGKTSLIEFLSKKSMRPLNNMVSQSDLVMFASHFGGGVNDIKSLAKPTVSGSPKGKIRASSLENVDVATDGIVIKDWTSKGPSGVRKGELETVAFSSWDFAGQEVYYYTHLFFLSHRGIYLLAFNLLKPEEEFSRIEYWLQSIHTRARGAPVILVGTHLDDPKCSKKYLDGLYANLLQKFSGQFKSIRFFFALSCTTGKGVEDLKKKLTEVAIQMAEKEGKVPLPYLTLEEKLKAVAAVAPQPVISWEYFQDIALSCGIPGPLIPKAAAFLHELGALVHFNEHESGLDDVVVLDSQWLTNVFSDVITLKHNFVKDGVLNKKDLPQIWKPPAYPENVHDSLVALLEKFEVAYSLPQLPDDGGAGILVPCLLPSTRPGDLSKPGMWPKYEPASDVTQLGRFYSFNFMPFGFFNRFMVRLLRSGWVLQKAWKNGMFFIKASDKLLLELDNEVAYRLKLYMRGPNPAPAMLVLLASIDTLIADWLKVEVKVDIPCPHCIKDHVKPYLFSVAELEQAVSRGNTVVLCRGVDAVSVYGLAPDLALTETNRPVIPYTDLTISNELYSTNQNKTLKGTYKNETVLVKQFTESPKEDKEKDGEKDNEKEGITNTFSTFRSEVWVMSGLRHPNIVELKGFCTSPLCLVMEYMDMGTLYTFIHEKSNAIDWNLRLKIASDVARGMAFLHSITPPIIHRDLTSHSVLLSMENPTSEASDKPTLTAKISDFGLSRSLLLADNLVSETQQNPVWLAPEILCKRKYNEKADIYSFGVIIWELLTREDYFGDKDWKTIETNVVIGQRPPIPDCFVEYQELLNECWHTEPAHRPSAPAIVKRLSRIARKYNFAIPTSTSAVLMPSASVRQFFAPNSSNYENLDDDVAEDDSSTMTSAASLSPRATTITNVAAPDEKGKEKIINTESNEDMLVRSKSMPGSKAKEKTPRYASTIESEFIAGQQRAKITRLEETVQSLHNKLREAVRAKNQAERNLAFQILENDRQQNRLEMLKAKVTRLKIDIEDKEKERMLGGGVQSPKITKSLSRRSYRGRSLPPDEGKAAAEKLAALSTAPLRKKSIVSEEDGQFEGEEKEKQKEGSSIVVQNGDGLKRETSKMDVREIQERLRRRQVSKRILDRLAYFERLQGSALSSSPPSASNLHSLLASDPQGREESLPEKKDVAATTPKAQPEPTLKTSIPAGSKTPPATRRATLGKGDTPIRRVTKGDEALLRSVTDDGLSYSGGSQGPTRENSAAAGLSLSSSNPILRTNNGSRHSGNMPTGINQIFYGKEELIKLLLELDEFD